MELTVLLMYRLSRAGLVLLSINMAALIGVCGVVVVSYCNNDDVLDSDNFK